MHLSTCLLLSLLFVAGSTAYGGGRIPHLNFRAFNIPSPGDAGVSPVEGRLKRGQAEVVDNFAEEPTEARRATVGFA